MRLSTVHTRESKWRGHYIAFCNIEGVWYRFDDAVVHSVVLQPAYNVNLVIYKRADQPDYPSATDLLRVPHLGRTVILNRNNKPSESEKALQEVAKELQWPPLITPDKAKDSTSTEGSPFTAEHPTQHQPKRSQKEYVVYYADDSQSSDKENLIDKTHSDSEYTPKKEKGNVLCCTFQANIHGWDRSVKLTSV